MRLINVHVRVHLTFENAIKTMKSEFLRSGREDNSNCKKEKKTKILQFNSACMDFFFIVVIQLFLNTDFYQLT